jgi:hypothetical protein
VGEEMHVLPHRGSSLRSNARRRRGPAILAAIKVLDIVLRAIRHTIMKRPSRLIAMMMKSQGISGRRLLDLVGLSNIRLRKESMLALVLLSMRMRGRRVTILFVKRMGYIVLGVDGVLG